jgi:hypothetical protein
MHASFWARTCGQSISQRRTMSICQLLLLIMLVFLLLLVVLLLQ